MSPELIKAVKERIVLGRSKESIVEELHQAGHSDEVVEQAFKQAELQMANPTDFELRPIPVSALPGAFELIKNGWAFTKARTDFVLLIMLPLLILTLIDYLASSSALSAQPVFFASASAISFVALVFYLLSVNALLYVVSKPSEQTINYKDALTWSKANFFGLLWVSILTAAVVVGGFWLFIIPGIIVSFYLYFAQYVYVNEGLRGFDALLRSRAIVSGNWWSVVTRVASIGLIFLLGLFGFGLIAGLLTIGFADEMTFDFVFDFGSQALSALVVIIFVHAGAALYRGLLSHSPAQTVVTPDPNKWKYMTLAMLGLVLTVLFLGLAFNNQDSFDQLEDSFSKSQVFAVRQQLEDVYNQAEDYYVENNSSYIGVCKAIKSSILEFERVTCNEVGDSFATSLALEIDEWCTDSTGYQKTIKRPLGERTACLDLGQ